MGSAREEGHVADRGGGMGRQLHSLDTRCSKSLAEAGHVPEVQPLEEAALLLSHAGQREWIAQLCLYEIADCLCGYLKYCVAGAGLVLAHLYSRGGSVDHAVVVGGDQVVVLDRRRLVHVPAGAVLVVDKRRHDVDSGAGLDDLLVDDHAVGGGRVGHVADGQGGLAGLLAEGHGVGSRRVSDGQVGERVDDVVGVADGHGSDGLVAFLGDGRDGGQRVEQTGFKHHRVHHSKVLQAKRRHTQS